MRGWGVVVLAALLAAVLLAADPGSVFLAAVIPGDPARDFPGDPDSVFLAADPARVFPGDPDTVLLAADPAPVFPGDPDRADPDSALVLDGDTYIDRCWRSSSSTAAASKRATPRPAPPPPIRPGRGFPLVAPPA